MSPQTVATMANGSTRYHSEETWGGDAATAVWLNDLEKAMQEARRLYGDVAWRSTGTTGIDLWAHKAIIYARDPKILKSNHRTHGNSDTLEVDSRPSSPASTVPGNPVDYFTSRSGLTERQELRTLYTAYDIQALRTQLSWVYTAKNNDISFESISNVPVGHDRKGTLGYDGHDGQERLRQDLLYMWRSKLYADVRITVIGTHDGSPHHDGSAQPSMGEFYACHRFILSCRSPYFATLLRHLQPDEHGFNNIFLPCQVTASSIQTCLRYIYTGSLNVTISEIDLTQALQLYDCAKLLELPHLLHHIESHIIDHLCHGMLWIRCHCETCQVRTRQVWLHVFGSARERMEGKARAYLVDGWETSWDATVAEASPDRRSSLVEALLDRITVETASHYCRRSSNMIQLVADGLSRNEDRIMARAEPARCDFLRNVALSVYERAVVLLVDQHEGARPTTTQSPRRVSAAVTEDRGDAFETIKVQNLPGHNIPVRKERLPDIESYRHEQSTLDKYATWDHPRDILGQCSLGAAGKPQHDIKHMNRPSSRYKKRRETKQASLIADHTLTRQLAGPLDLHLRSLLSLAEVDKKAISPINDNHDVLPEQAGQQQPMVDFMTQTSTVDPQTGIALNVGIPCIVVHHGGPRIKACIQYIGHVEGLVGPRVGVISKDFIGTSVPALSTGTYLGRHYFDVPPDDGKDFASGRTCAELDLQDSPERINHKAPATARYCRAFFVRPCDILVVLGGAL